MIKRITIVARKAGLSDAEFDRRWRVQHAPMVLSLPGVCGYVQNQVTEATTPDAKGRRIDGFAEIWFESRAAMDAALATDTWRAIVADAQEFMGEIAGYSIEERVFRPVAQPAA